MLSCCTNYLASMPEITVYMNCDTRLAVNLSLFDLGDFDEFIFTIKNYDYIDSPAVFLFRATKTDMDKNGEVIFKIDPEASKNIKQGAFYNFAVLINAFNPTELSEYKKLTENGRINIEYGAHDLALDVPNEQESIFNEVLGAYLELIDEPSVSCGTGAVVDMRLEQVTDEEV